MPRTKTPIHATIYAVNSLSSMAGDPETLFMDATAEDGRKVYIGFRASDWAVSAYGKNSAEAGRMRKLAATLVKQAERLEAIPDAADCAFCTKRIHYSVHTAQWHAGDGTLCNVADDGHHSPDGKSLQERTGLSPTTDL